MFYTKNVPTWERALRIVFGLAALGYAAWSWGQPAAMGFGITGAILSVTGLFGFCPACAMVGRNLNKKP